MQKTILDMQFATISHTHRPHGHRRTLDTQTTYNVQTVSPPFDKHKRKEKPQPDLYTQRTHAEYNVYTRKRAKQLSATCPSVVQCVCVYGANHGAHHFSKLVHFFACLVYRLVHVFAVFFSVFFFASQCGIVLRERNGDYYRLVRPSASERSNVSQHKNIYLGYKYNMKRKK